MKALNDHGERMKVVVVLGEEEDGNAWSPAIGISHMRLNL